MEEIDMQCLKNVKRKYGRNRYAVSEENKKN